MTWGSGLARHLFALGLLLGQPAQGQVSVGGLLDGFVSSPEMCDALPSAILPCPAKGCLPCPSNAAGQPDCACLEGYSLTDMTSTSTSSATASTTATATSTASTTRTSVTSTVTTLPGGAATTPTTTSMTATTSTEDPNATATATPTTTTRTSTTSSPRPVPHWAELPLCSLAADAPLLGWDPARGWLGKCEPDVCGPTPIVPHAQPVSEEEAPSRLVFPQTARFLCDVGYQVQQWATEEAAEEPFTYDRYPGMYCTNDRSDSIYMAPFTDEESCAAACTANATCAAYEATCDGLCILLSHCEEQLPSACGTALVVRRPLDPERLIALQCAARGEVKNLTGDVCLPTCGDGLLVETDHLPPYSRLEQCDDGNAGGGDGCSSDCRVEAGWICNGGSVTGPDTCKEAEVYAESKLWLILTGMRVPSTEELLLASEEALSRALQCPLRDLEIYSVRSSHASDVVAAKFDATTTSTTTTEPASTFHAIRVEAEIAFKVKISDPSTYSVDEAEGALRKSGVLLPKIMVAYTDFTSLGDLYVSAVDVQVPVVSGDRAFGQASAGFSLSGTLSEWSVVGGPLLGYLFLLGVGFPWVYWFLRIRVRPYRLMGRYDEVAEEFKGGWAYNVCSWMNERALCCALICCLPARMADTWDALGLVPYWEGVRRSFCCCLLYMGGCCVCGACIPGGHRSDIRDFFGFGDKVKGNVELSDYCCYLCCPLCCVIQEAKHIDAALEVLPPPSRIPWYMRKGGREEDDGVVEEEEEDADSLEDPPDMLMMNDNV